MAGGNSIFQLGRRVVLSGFIFSLTLKIFQFTFSPHKSPTAANSSAAVNTKIYLHKMGSRRRERSSLLEEIYVNDFM